MQFPSATHIAAARKLGTLLIVAPLLLCLDCAMRPAGLGTKGTKISVTLQFAGPINANYQYFFLIRNAGDSVGGNGPVPVIAPPYLNGFATGKTNDTTNPQYTAGFTDFVEYSARQRQPTASGYNVYHLPGGVKGDPNRDIFIATGDPEVAATPTAGGTALRFELALARVTPNVAGGELDPSNGTNRYLQVNVIATTTTPHDPQNIDTTKFLDAFGDQRDPTNGFTAYLTIDTTQIGRIYKSGDTPALTEPDNDTYPGPSDPGIEMTGWSIQILGQ